MVLLTGRSDPNSLQMRCHISTWILKKVILLFSYNQLYIYIYVGIEFRQYIYIENHL